MLRGMGTPCHAEVVSISGANVESMINLVEGFTVKGPTKRDVSLYRCLVFHVGTNNLDDSNGYIQNGFLSLLGAIRAKCTNPQVFISCILPHRDDHRYTWPKIREMNRWLRRWAKSEGIQTIDAAPLFLDNSGRVLDYLYRDNVHLNSGGLKKLRDKFKQVLSMSLHGYS